MVSQEKYQVLGVRKGSLPPFGKPVWVHGRSDMGFEEIGERRTFQTEVTMGRKILGLGSSLVRSKGDMCKGKTQEITPDRETDTRLWRKALKATVINALKF